MDRVAAAERSVRSQAGKNGLSLLQVQKHRVAEHFLAATGLATGLRTGVGAGRAQVDQPVRLEHRQRLEQDLIEEREYGRVASDPQGEREHCYGRDEGCP